jgi:hypothetical protein
MNFLAFRKLADRLVLVKVVLGWFVIIKEKPQVNINGFLKIGD